MLLLLKIPFILVCLLQVVMVVLNFVFSLQVGDKLSPINLIELLFPLLMIIVILRHDDDSEYVCFKIPGSVFTLVYIIWTTLSIILLIILMLLRTDKIKLPQGEAGDTFATIFGTNGQTLDPRVFAIGFVYLSIQTVAWVIAVIVHRQIKEADVEFKGFA